MDYNSKKAPLKAADFIEKLIAKGRYTFATLEAEQALQVSPAALRAALRRLRQKGKIVDPIRGFQLILTPEYRTLGCMPPEYFIDDLMQHVKSPYYVGLLSAAQLHGAAHQQPQQFQVVTNKARLDINCGQAHIVFIKRSNIKNMPVTSFNTSYGNFLVSTPEVTAMDLVTYPQHCAGINHVATILSDLVEKIIPEKLLKLVELTHELAWLQRLGYLLDFLNEEKMASVIKKYLTQQRTQPCALQSSVSIENAVHDKKWNILINVELELDI